MSTVYGEIMVTFDTTQKGLEIVLKDYQVEAMKYIWSLEEGEGASSRDVWINCNVALVGVKTISRASIINFCNAMVDDKILGYHEITGKGGHRRIYKKIYDEEGTKRFLALLIINKLSQEWPTATKAVLENL